LKKYANCKTQFVCKQSKLLMRNQILAKNAMHGRAGGCLSQLKLMNEKEELCLQGGKQHHHIHKWNI